MTLSLLIIINVVLDVALVGLLSFVMTRPAKLRPTNHHVRLARMPEGAPARSAERRMADAA
ncbi:MAG: hypothetical protein ACRDLP_03840 [Solirubrobacteraceae bacterium]